MAEMTVTNKASKHKEFWSGRMPGELCISIPGLVKDLEDLQTKLYLVSEYTELVYKRDNVENGMDGIYLLLNDLGGELSSIIDCIKGGKNV
jgi:hypothetical protein